MYQAEYAEEQDMATERDKRGVYPRPKPKRGSYAEERLAHLK